MALGHRLLKTIIQVRKLRIFKRIKIMKLNFQLSSEIKKVLSEATAEKIRYCVPFDISPDGELSENGFTVVTDRHILTVDGKGILQNIAIDKIDDIRVENAVNCGILICSTKGEDLVLARYSMHHAVRYPYIVRAVKMIRSGDSHTVESLEPELICEKCGHAMPGTEYCPRCQGARRMFRRIGALSKPYIPGFIVLSLAMLLSTVLTLWQQSVQKDFIDNVLVTNDGVGSMSDIPKYIILLCIAVFGLISINIAKRIISVKLGSRISKELRAKLFFKIQSLSLSYQNTRKPGDLMNRVTGDTMQIRRFIEDVFSNVFTVLITLIGALIMMFVMDIRLTLIALAPIPFILVLNRIFRRKIHRIFHNQRRKEDRINSRLQDVLSGIRVVKCFGRERFEAERFSNDAEQFAATQEYAESFWAKFQPLLGFLAGFGSSLVLYIGGIDIVNGTGFTIGQMSQFVAYAGMIYWPLGWMSNIPRMIMNMTVSLSRIDDIMSQTPEIADCEKPVKKEIEGNVTFKDVTFGYKNYEPVLEHIDFEVKKGEMIGLVGASGSGKSTMINLIMRLYDCDEGEILIDGTDIKKYSGICLHSQIGVVLQETFLFADTIMNNILFAKPDATREEVIKAAKTAGAHDFICKFPDGYDTFVGDSGSKLSGGERQRIAIARAVLGDPRLLILDEATSSLDTESEFFIQKGLERLKKGRTTFAIAHRLSTLKGADRLFVIDNHHIAETGSHDELLKNSTIYRGLVEAQSELHAVKGPGGPPPPPR